MSRDDSDDGVANRGDTRERVRPDDVTSHGCPREGEVRTARHPVDSEPSTPAAVTLLPLAGIPEVRAGDDVAELVADSLRRSDQALQDGDIVLVSSKIVAKAAGLRVPADQRVVAVLAQSEGVVAERRTPSGITRVVRARSGPVLAGAGIDASNTGPGTDLLLLPGQPDVEAARLRDSLRATTARAGTTPCRLAVVLTDTAGRPWRHGQTDFALGAAGVRVLDDLRGQPDDDGRMMTVTARAVGDELAAAADLVKAKTSRVPVVVVRGLGHLVTDLPDAVDSEGLTTQGAAALVRDGEGDWFARGDQEAVRAALGVPPGSNAAVEVGIRDVSAETTEQRVARACLLATRAEGLGAAPPSHPRAHLVRHRPDLSQVTVDTVQAGPRLQATNPVALGIVVGRLLAALAGEGLPAALGDVSAPQRPGAPYTASIVLL